MFIRAPRLSAAFPMPELTCLIDRQVIHALRPREFLTIDEENSTITAGCELVDITSENHAQGRTKLPSVLDLKCTIPICKNPKEPGRTRGRDARLRETHSRRGYIHIAELIMEEACNTIKYLVEDISRKHWSENKNSYDTNVPGKSFEQHKTAVLEILRPNVEALNRARLIYSLMLKTEIAQDYLWDEKNKDRMVAGAIMASTLVQRGSAHSHFILSSGLTDLDLELISICRHVEHAEMERLKTNSPPEYYTGKYYGRPAMPLRKWIERFTIETTETREARAIVDFSRADFYP